MTDFFAEEEPMDVNSFDKSMVERLELIDKLDEKQKGLLYGVIDTFLTNQKLKDVLANAAQIAA